MGSSKVSLGNGLFTLIDVDNYYRVSEYTWCLSRGNYATTSINGVTTLLQRFILTPPNNMVVDHVDGDRLDNRRKNLRVCTQSENARNRHKHIRTTTSKFKGVSYNKEISKWVARIRVDNNKYGLGSYYNELDAALAYNIGSVLLSPTFGKLNNIHKILNDNILSDYTTKKLIRLSRHPLNTTLDIISRYKKTS